MPDASIHLPPNCWALRIVVRLHVPIMLGVLLAVLLVLAVWFFAGLPSLGAFGLLGTLSWWLATWFFAFA